MGNQLVLKFTILPTIFSFRRFKLISKSISEKKTLRNHLITLDILIQPLEQLQLQSIIDIEIK